jgi:hypothetical protein
MWLNEFFWLAIQSFGSRQSHDGPPEYAQTGFDNSARKAIAFPSGSFARRMAEILRSLLNQLQMPKAAEWPLSAGRDSHHTIRHLFSFA